MNCFGVQSGRIIKVSDHSHHDLLPATVNLDDMLTPGWFLHSTVVSFLANVSDAVTCRVDVKFVLILLLAMLVRVAINGSIETTIGSLGVGV